MGFSEAKSQCKKHPDHKQQTGVCPFCLREKLSQLNTAPTVVLHNKRSATIAPSSSGSLASSSHNSSTASSRCDSPVNCRGRHHRNVSEVLSSLSFKLISLGNNNNNELKKSRSIAFVPRNLHSVAEVKNGKKKNNNIKKGFWSKLLPLKGNKRDVLMQHHPRTVSLRLF